MTESGGHADSLQRIVWGAAIRPGRPSPEHGTDCKTAEAHRLSGLSTDLSTHSAERGGTRRHASQELRDGTADQTGFPATRRYQESWRPANSGTVCRCTQSGHWALCQASQIAGRSLPRSGTSSPAFRAQARTSATVGSGGSGAPRSWRSFVVVHSWAAGSVAAQCQAAAR